MDAAASVIAIVTVTIQGVRALIDTIDSIKNAPASLKDARKDLKTLEPTLDSLQQAAQQNAGLSASRISKVKPAVEQCQHACVNFQTQLERRLKKSSNLDQPNRIEIVMIGLFREREIQSLRSQLGVCKETLTLVLVADRFIEMPEKDTLNTVKRVEDQMSEVRLDIQSLSESPLLDPEEEEKTKQFLQELRSQADRNESLLKDCMESIAKLDTAEAKDETLREEVNVLSQQLKLTDPKEDRNDILRITGNRVDGTCEWLMAHKDYTGFLRADKAFLWVTGEPGKGKTVMSTFITEALTGHVASGANVHLIYYFCDQQDEKRNSAAAVLRGLLWQLSMKPTFRDRMVKHIAKQDRLLVSEPDSLWKLFAALMEDPDSGKVYCVLDGLDECDEDSCLWLAKRFLSLFAPGAREPELNVLRLILTSRDIPGFKLRGQSAQLSLDSDVSTDVDEDIARVVHSRLLDIPDWDNFNADFKAKVHQEVMHRAEGSFLQCNLVMKELTLGTKASGVMEALESLPHGTSALYGRMLLRVEESRRSETLELLKWVSMSMRRLKLKELASALGEGVGHEIFGTLEEVAIRSKVAACGDLLIVQDDVVAFRHKAASDFLLRKADEKLTDLEQFGQTEQDTLQYFRIDPQKVHLEIALKCLQLIKESHLQHKVLDLTDESEESALLEYAVMYWPLHARGAGEAGSTLFTSPSFVLATEISLRHNWWQTYVTHRKGEEWEQGHTLSPLHIASRFGIVEWVRAILTNIDQSSIKKMIDEVDINGLSPLAWAAIGGHAAVVELLLDHGADINAQTDLWAREGFNALSTDSLMSFQRELAVGASIWPRMLTALHRAAYMGHTNVVRLLLERKADSRAKGWAKCRPMHAAAVGGNVEVLQLLIEHGAKKDVNAELTSINTAPLHYAAEYGNCDAARILLDHGADVRKRQKFSLSTVLHFAPERHADPATVELLLERGADVNARDAHFRKPLHYFAMKHAPPGAIKILLDRGAKINARNSVGRSALDMAIDCECERCKANTQLLLAHGAGLKSPNATGKRIHPELFKPDSLEPLQQLAILSTTSIDEDDRTSHHPSIQSAEQSSMADGTATESDVLASVTTSSAKDSGLGLMDTEAGAEVGDDGTVASSKRTRMKAWMKRKLQ